MRTDRGGRSDEPGLYATVQVACSGVQGVNRLTTNSLREGLVVSRRITQVLPGEVRPWSEPTRVERTTGLAPRWMDSPPPPPRTSTWTRGGLPTC